MERIQVSIQPDCLKLCKLLQAHTGQSLSQIGNAALRAYMIDTIENDKAFRALAMAMETEPGSLVDSKLREIKRFNKDN